MSIVTWRPRRIICLLVSTVQGPGTTARAVWNADKDKVARSKDGARILFAPKEGSNGWHGRMAGTLTHPASDPGGAKHLGLKKAPRQGAGEICRKKAMKEHSDLRKPGHIIPSYSGTHLVAEGGWREACPARSARCRRGNRTRNNGNGNSNNCGKYRVRTAALNAAACTPRRVPGIPAGRAGLSCQAARRRALAVDAAPHSQTARRTGGAG